MLYWTIVAGVCILLAVVCAVIVHKSSWDSFAFIFSAFCGIMCGVVSLGIFLTELEVTCEYKNFIYEYEINAEIIDSNKEDPYYIVDIVNANAKLTEIQGNKKAWGKWSMYPNEVLNILPLGID